jgi:hypothetical protein
MASCIYSWSCLGHEWIQCLLFGRIPSIEQVSCVVAVSSNELCPLHCKAGEANTSLKTASCEAGPGTMLKYSYEIYIWRLLIQEFVDGCCCPNSNVAYQSVICTMII